MDQIAIGKFISKKRKEQNLTQDQLAERLGVSNKTISKWETGKCMPDYSVIESLCQELNITLAKLLDGEENEKSIHTYDSQQILKMLKETRERKNKKLMLIGIVVFLLGIFFLIYSQLIGGTDIQEALSGFTFGISFPLMLLGILLVIRSKCRKTKDRDL